MEIKLKQREDVLGNSYVAVEPFFDDVYSNGAYMNSDQSFSGSAMTYDFNYLPLHPVSPPREKKKLPATWKCNGCHAGNPWKEGSCTKCGAPKYDSVDYEWEKEMS